MHRIDTATKAVDLFGAGKHGFKAGDPSIPTPATHMSPDWCNDVQENIVRTVEGAGIALVKGDGTQLLTAIQQLIAAAAFGIPPLPDHVGPAADGDELAIVVGGVHQRITVAELFTGRATYDQVARDQIALTNLRQILSTSVSTSALAQGRQWELTTDEWATGSSGYMLVSASPNYYGGVASDTIAKSYTGADQTWTVPAGVTSVNVKLWGAGGGSTNTTIASGSADWGAGGGFVSGTMAVTPGETLTIVVGQGGSNETSTTYGGGGSGNVGDVQGGSGGGRSAIRRAGADIVTAGGGGGAGNSGNGALSGGVGGGLTGGDGASPTTANRGLGGTQGAGGAAGSGGTPGSQYQGGNGNTSASTSCGGGGGGYYGGGGGGGGASNGGGGGGGSSYVANLTGTVVNTQATSYMSANTADPDYGAGVGAGKREPADARGNGRVVISYNVANDMTLVSPAFSVSAAPSYVDAYMLYKDDSGAAVLGTDITVDLSRDGGTSWAAATLTTVAAFDGTYGVLKARADVSGQPSGTSLKARIKTYNLKAQRVAAPALYAE